MTPEERFDRIEQQIEKNTNGIRDLIVVSRTILMTAETVTEQIKELREAQAATDEKLNILIDTVDRIIRNLGKNGNKQ